MATTIVMPRAGISVESCIIGQWKKSPGDKVSIGEVLFDYETDKAAFECESTAEGTLLECFFESGDEVECLVAVCAIGEPGEDVSALRPTEGGGAAKAEAVPTVSRVPKAEPPAVPVASNPTASGINILGASPRARRAAEGLGVDIGLAVPTGPHGRVIERDVEALAASQRTGDGFGGRTFEMRQAVVPQAASPLSQDEYFDEKLSRIRKTIATRMMKSLAEMAQLTNHHSFDSSNILAYRKACKAGGEGMIGMNGITLGDMVLYAVSQTLLAHPDINAHLIGDDTLRRFNGVHLGVAVDTPRGLMVPTIFNSDKMTLLEISQKIKELASQCQSGSINPNLLQGATFTVSNLGVLGVEHFTPIINPPQVAILGVSGMTTRVKEDAEGVAVYQAMGLSLSYDHRAIDGVPASRFARDLGNNLAQFSLMLAK